MIIFLQHYSILKDGDLTAAMLFCQRFFSGCHTKDVGEKPLSGFVNGFLPVCHRSGIEIDLILFFPEKCSIGRYFNRWCRGTERSSAAGRKEDQMGTSRCQVGCTDEVIPRTGQEV